jgi:hypothetical protein
MFRVLVASVSVLAVAVAGCGGNSGSGETADTTAVDTAAVVDTALVEVPETPALSETIVLPAGWEMSDAISAGEVEAVIGRTGYQYWHETLSDPAAGKPQGSYYDGSLAASKVNFLVYTTEGQANYDRVLGFVQNPVEVANTDGANPMWDQAVVGEMIDMADTLAAILVRRGDVCIRIRYDLAVYPELDRTGTLTKLAEELITNLYGG